MNIFSLVQTALELGLICSLDVYKRQAQEIIHRARKILSAVRMRRSENREVTK